MYVHNELKYQHRDCIIISVIDIKSYIFKFVK